MKCIHVAADTGIAVLWVGWWGVGVLQQPVLAIYQKRRWALIESRETCLSSCCYWGSCPFLLNWMFYLESAGAECGRHRLIWSLQSRLRPTPALTCPQAATFISCPLAFPICHLGHPEEQGNGCKKDTKDIETRLRG